MYNVQGTCQLIIYYIVFLVFYVNNKGMDRTSQSWRPINTQLTMVPNMLPYLPCRNEISSIRFQTHKTTTNIG